ncbi:hypothetical protein [Mastigocoleus sp. MO_188.B34]|nr:hypothetical protein [Mastigocoleus sp. MO_188.B34]MDJ0695569.1 hypothetical protein [Mastigocoleus sp. MO_188.B34]
MSRPDKDQYPKDQYPDRDRDQMWSEPTYDFNQHTNKKPRGKTPKPKL